MESLKNLSPFSVLFYMNTTELPNGNFAYQKDKSVLGVNKSFFKVKDGLIFNLLNVVLKIKNINIIDM